MKQPLSAKKATSFAHSGDLPATCCDWALRKVWLAAILSMPVTAALAVDTTLTPSGFTGLSITPNAHLVPWGRFEATYDNQLPGNVSDTRGHNFVGGFGLLPNIEVVGRLAANSLHSNCFTQGCGARDLSASFKAGIGLDAANRFRVAAGMTDVGGTVTYFRSYYGVLTYNEGPVELSGGLAKRSGNGVGGSRAPLNGPFGSAAWQPLPLVRGHVEYTDRNAWAGLRLFAPDQWLPEGWLGSVGVNQRLTHSTLTAKSWWSVALSIPLYKVPDLSRGGPRAPLPALGSGQYPLPSYEARALPAGAVTGAESPAGQAVESPVGTATAVVSTLVAPTAALDDDQLVGLAAALKAKGLGDISVGRMPDKSIAVLVNNASYKWNSIDALGVALGTVARTLGTFKAGYRLILTERQIPLVAVTGQTDCLSRWVNNETQNCSAGELSTPGKGALEPLHAGVSWVVQGLQPGWKTVRLGFSPVLRTSFGTELGVLDFSAGANASLTLPLWRGASVEYSRNVPLARTSDYQAQGAFGNRRVLSATERLALTQTARLPLESWFSLGDEAKAAQRGLNGLTVQATVGRVGTVFDGVHGAVRWEPGEGLHRLTAQGGIFRNADFNKIGTVNQTLRTARPTLLNYRYALMPTRTYLEATAGQFMSNDRGLQLGMRQWFSDVAVNLFYRRTSFANTGARSFAGIEFSVPIGPRSDYRPSDFFQVGGTQRFSHTVETLVGGFNFVSPGYGVLPPVPSIEATFNSDRASLAYFEDNMRRIRDAAR